MGWGRRGEKEMRWGESRGEKDEVRERKGEGD